jgi:AbiV family abortive infection protein
VTKTLNTYKGRLSPSQATAGMNAAANNARRLAEDSAILLADGRWPTAASIAILAIEEAGKISILRALALARSDEEALGEWKDYRAHTKKNAAWTLPNLAAAGARSLEDMRPLFDSTSDHPQVLDQLKQLGFYTDCLGASHWSEPTKVVDEKLASSLVQIAKLFARDHKYDEKELELWVEHIGPVWKKDMPRMQQALINWNRAMETAGLTETSTQDMESFVRGGGLTNAKSPSSKG